MSDPALAQQSFLGFDYGEKRVGVATGNTVTSTATALTTLSLVGDARFAAIARLIAEWQPDALVVGVPYHPDGAAHDNTHKAKRFANQLLGRFKLPVHQVDERYTTTDAKSSGARDLDAASAALIIEQYLRQL
jgi:putative Holliday junction resolvase